PSIGYPKTVFCKQKAGSSTPLISTISPPPNGTAPPGVIFNFPKTPPKTCISSSKLKLPESKRVLWGGGTLVVLLLAVAYYFAMPAAEVAEVRRGTAIAAVYGTVRIEPAFVVHVRAQNSGFITLADPFAAGRGAIGKSVEKGQLLATIADEATA